LKNQSELRSRAAFLRKIQVGKVGRPVSAKWRSSWLWTWTRGGTTM